MIQRPTFYEDCYVLSLFIQHIDFCSFLITINISRILAYKQILHSFMRFDLIFFFIKELQKLILS